MFNNIKLIDKAFDKLYEVEKRINYEYEPIYDQKIEGWKRNLFYPELKRDFVKDVTEFGFCPYIPKEFIEQQKIKNISKFSKADNFRKLDYLKSLYKKIDSDDNNKESIKSNNSNRKGKNWLSLTSMRINKNKSIKNIHFTNNKKKFFLKKISNPNFKDKLKNIDSNIKLKLKNSNTITQKNSRKNISMVNICYKKDKTVNKSENEFIDAESFIYEPEKMFYKYYNKANDSMEEESTHIPKTNTIINNISKKENIKGRLEITPKTNNIHLKPINYFKHLKGTLSARNNINNIEEKIFRKNSNNTLLIKNKEINRFLKKVKIKQNNNEVKGFRLLNVSRKMKYG